MKVLVSCVICSLNVIFSLNSYAGGNISIAEIQSVGFNSGGVYIYGVNTNNANNGCTNSSAIVLKDSDPNYDKAYAAILMAYASGKSVSGWSDGCVDHDGQSFNSIRGYKYFKVY